MDKTTAERWLEWALMVIRTYPGSASAGHGRSDKDGKGLGNSVSVSTDEVSRGD